MRMRRMEAGDTAAVATLCTQLGYASTGAEVARRFDLLAGNADHAVFVAEAEQGQVVGWVHVHGRRLLVAEPFADLGGLVVDEGWQGRGIGRALMAQAEAWARDQGYAQLSVRSNVVRERAHAFYERLGYRRVKSSHVFAKPLHGS